MNHTSTGSLAGKKTAWDAALSSVAASFRMDEVERERFVTHRIPRLIAALPYLAGCELPERSAVAHLGLYLLSVRTPTRAAFFAQPEDDGEIFARLRLGMQFRGGDQAIIDRGMALIALSMVGDYARDGEVDAMLGKHNPVSTGAWDAEAIIAELQQRVQTVSCPEMDEIVDVDGSVDTWWSIA